MPDPPELRILRRLVLVILALGLTGLAIELVLLDHDEDIWQIVPLVVIAMSLGVLGWHTLSGGATSVRALRMAMALLILSGAAGIYLHYRGNMEFQLELDPSMGGVELLMAVLRAKAPPALAPGHLALLGCLGLAGTYRHPACVRDDESSTGG